MSNIFIQLKEFKNLHILLKQESLPFSVATIMSKVYSLNPFDAESM